MQNKAIKQKRLNSCLLERFRLSKPLPKFKTLAKVVLMLAI
jgi:hypothetical protein